MITINTPGLPLGATLPCAVSVGYGSGQAARWTGTVSMPGSLAVRYAHTGNGVYAQLPQAPQSGAPAWAIALIAITSALLAGVGVLLYRQRRLR